MAPRSSRLPAVDSAAMRYGLLLCLCSGLLLSTGVLAQAAPQLVETGHIAAAGKQIPFRIRNLPVDAFPGLPVPVAAALTARGCLIPQTYEAHHPENVIHGSFERKDSSDWAALCSVQGKVSLLVFLESGSPATPLMLEAHEETNLLQPQNPAGELGFNWSIGAGTPAQVHDAQAGMAHRPPPPEHDCIADSVLDKPVVYRCYRNGEWVKLDTE